MLHILATALVKRGDVIDHNEAVNKAKISSIIMNHILLMGLRFNFFMRYV
jgi:hypothetical protein